MPLEQNLRIVSLRSDKDEFMKLHDKVQAERKDAKATYLTTSPIRKTPNFYSRNFAKNSAWRNTMVRILEVTFRPRG